VAESCRLAVGTRVPEVADMTTTAVVGVGGAVGPSPPQDPISQQRAISPSGPYTLFITKPVFMRGNA
jgi:hypothetical protein